MKNKKVLIILGVVVALVLVYVICAVTGNLQPATAPQNEEPNNPSISSTPEEHSNNVSFGWNPENAKSEDGTSARVDEILLQANNAAKEMDEEQAESAWEEAFEYLKQHRDNLFESPEVMEHSMYYGQFLYRYIEENAAATAISELPDSLRTTYDAGYNTVKAIKYVYYGAEKIEDASTQSALSEATEALNKLK